MCGCSTVLTSDQLKTIADVGEIVFNVIFKNYRDPTDGSRLDVVYCKRVSSAKFSTILDLEAEGNVIQVQHPAGTFVSINRDQIIELRAEWNKNYNNATDLSSYYANMASDKIVTP
jgi:predicted nucleic acid-binding protein